MAVDIVVSTQIAHPAPRVTHRLGCRDHIERHRKRATFVDVVQPQLRPRELPLHVTVLLHVQSVINQVTLYSFNQNGCYNDRSNF